MAEKPRLAILHSVIGYGGSIASLLDLLDMLKPQYAITVYMPAYAVPKAKEAVMAQKDIQTVLFSKAPMVFAHYSGIRALRQPGFWRSMLLARHNAYWYKTLRDYDAVLLNSSTLSPTGAYLTRRGQPTVCFDRETYSMAYGGVLHRIMRSYLNKNGAVCFLSDAERAVFRLDAPSFTVHDVLNEEKYPITGRRDAIRAELGIGEDEVCLLFVGGLGQPIKGASVLLDAFPAVREKCPNVRLVILGAEGDPSSDYVQSCREKIAKINRTAADTVLSLGSQAGIGRFYEAADVLVFPSTRAHQARPLYEAGFYSLPAVISDFPDTAEFAVDGENVLTAAPLDAADFAGKLCTLCGDAALREKLGKNNREKCMSQHSFSAEGQVLLSALAAAKEKKSCKENV